MPNGLDIGYHAVLFYGLTLTERVDVTDGITLLPFEQLRAFVDNRLVEELAPPGGGFHDWRSIGAAVSVPMEAYVPPVGPRRGLRTVRSAAVLLGSPDLLGSAWCSACHAGALPCSVGLLY